MLRAKIFGNPSTSVIRNDDEACESIDLTVNNCRPEDVSKYFPNLIKPPVATIADQILQLQVELNRKLYTFNFKTGSIRYVYNPLEYAFELNAKYVRKFCDSTKEIVFVGMNPGPYGMCQTGIPFGDPNWVKNWMNLQGEILIPCEECPDRRITGFASTRKEVSGDRFWSFFAALCGQPENFFEHSFVYNYCPVMFMMEGGKNVTPSEIKELQIRKSLEDACNTTFLKLILLLQPKIIVAVGTYVDKKCKDLIKNNNLNNIKILYMPHPSPRAVNNTNWHEKAEAFLSINNLTSYFRNGTFSS